MGLLYLSFTWFEVAEEWHFIGDLVSTSFSSWASVKGLPLGGRIAAVSVEDFGKCSLDRISFRRAKSRLKHFIYITLYISLHYISFHFISFRL